jgi:hypothetical protein
MGPCADLKGDEDLCAQLVKELKLVAIECESPQRLILVTNAIGCDNAEAIAEPAGEMEIYRKAAAPLPRRNWVGDLEPARL